MNKTMIMVAPNGARKTKKDHSALPVTERQTVAEMVKCVAAGASVLHAHVRDENARHVLDAQRYKKLIALMDEKLGDNAITQITTEAVGVYSPVEQIACVKVVKPVAVSIALKEIIPDDANEDQAKAFFIWMQNEKISPQFILYEAGEVERVFQLQLKGVIPFSNPFLLFVLGRYAKDQQSLPSDLQPFLTALAGKKANWAVCAFGKKEADCALAAAKAGGHIRIGFENNLHLPDGEIAPDNAALVTVCVELLKSENISIMDSQEARALLRQSLR